jgi:hypothetical protein
MISQISKHHLADDLLLTEFLQFFLFSSFSYMNNEAIVKTLEHVLSECDLLGLIRLATILPLSAIPLEVTDKFLHSVLGKCLDILEFIVVGGGEANHHHFLIGASIAAALSNIVIEAFENQLVKASLPRMVSLVVKGLQLQPPGKRATFVNLVRCLVSVPDLMLSIITQQDNTFSILDAAMIVYELSRCDLNSRQKDAFLKWTCELVPVNIVDRFEKIIMEHVVSCFAQTSPAISILELPPFSSFHPTDTFQSAEKSFDHSSVLSRLSSELNSLCRKFDLSKSIEHLQGIIDHNPSLTDWVENELDTLMARARQQCLIKRKT